MQLPVRAALLASTVALLVGTASGIAIYRFVLRPDLPLSTQLSVGASLGIVTAAASFGMVFFFVRMRLAKAKPAMGAGSGALLGVFVLAITTLVHSAVSPGAYGWPLSFLGQFPVALILVGWLALLVGAILGRHIGRAAP